MAAIKAVVGNGNGGFHGFVIKPSRWRQKATKKFDGAPHKAKLTEVFKQGVWLKPSK